MTKQAVSKNDLLIKLSDDERMLDTSNPSIRSQTIQKAKLSVSQISLEFNMFILKKYINFI
jgi:hypothetical protein